jgi:hypothetical protein
MKHINQKNWKPMISWLSITKGILFYVTIFNSIIHGQLVENDYEDSTGDFIPSFGPHGPPTGPSTSPFKRAISNSRGRSGMQSYSISKTTLGKHRRKLFLN